MNTGKPCSLPLFLAAIGKHATENRFIFRGNRIKHIYRKSSKTFRRFPSRKKVQQSLAFVNTPLPASFLSLFQKQLDEVSRQRYNVYPHEWIHLLLDVTEILRNQLNVDIFSMSKEF